MRIVSREARTYIFKRIKKMMEEGSYADMVYLLFASMDSRGLEQFVVSEPSFELIVSEIFNISMAKSLLFVSEVKKNMQK